MPGRPGGSGGRCPRSRSRPVAQVGHGGPRARRRSPGLGRPVGAALRRWRPARRPPARRPGRRHHQRGARPGRVVGAIQIIDGFSLVDVQEGVADAVIARPPRGHDPRPAAPGPARPVAGRADPSSVALKNIGRREASNRHDPTSTPLTAAVATGRALLDRVFPRGAILLSVLSLAYFATGHRPQPGLRQHLRRRRRARRLQRGVPDPRDRPRRAGRGRSDRAVRPDLQPAPARRGRRRAGQRLRADGADRAPSA